MTDRNIFDFLLNLIQNDYRPLENGEHRRRRRRPRREHSTPQPPQSRPRRSRVNRNRARDRRRWETYTLCIICFEPTAIPTHRMPCCRQFIHEECLLQCFRHSSFHRATDAHIAVAIYSRRRPYGGNTSATRPLPLYF